MRALSTNTVFVRCWATTAESGSWNFTKHTRDDTGKGESSGGKRRSSSILPRKPKRVRICSELALGETLVTWITSVPLLEAIASPPAPPVLQQTQRGRGAGEARAVRFGSLPPARSAAPAPPPPPARPGPAVRGPPDPNKARKETHKASKGISANISAG